MKQCRSAEKQWSGLGKLGGVIEIGGRHKSHASQLLRGAVRGQAGIRKTEMSLPQPTCRPD
jgi:hypothetical protein